MQNRQSISAARWNSRASGPLPTAKNSLNLGAGVIRELEDLTKKLNLGEPSYKLSGGTETGRGYFCSVDLGGHHAGSLDEYASSDQAKVAAAFHAVNLLKTYYADKLALIKQPPSSLENTTVEAAKTEENNCNGKPELERAASDEFERVVENLLILLENKPRGIYSHALAASYLETYKQNLPPDWLTRIKDEYPEFVVDTVDSFRSIVAKRRNVKSSQKLQGRPSIAKLIGDSGADLTVPTINSDADLPVPTINSGADLPVTTINSGADLPVTTISSGADLPITTINSKEEQPVCDSKQNESSKEIKQSTPPKLEDNEDAEQVVANSQVRTKVRFSDQVDERYFKRQEGEEQQEIIQQPDFDQSPPFSLPEDTSHWHVFVSVVKTPGDFMVRLLGEEYSDQYEQLQRDMQKYYEELDQGTKVTVSSSDVASNGSLLGRVYAARAEECWHRVYLNEIIPADEGIADEGVVASVYFIDHGDCETISFDELRILEQRFMRLPCQAAPACLAGFENFSHEDWTHEMIERFRELTLGKVLAAKFTGTVNSTEEGVGSLLLLLEMPIEMKSPAVSVDSEIGQSNNNSPTTPLINELMMQITAKTSMNKMANVGFQSVTATMMLQADKVVVKCGVE